MGCPELVYEIITPKWHAYLEVFEEKLRKSTPCIKNIIKPEPTKKRK